MEPDLGVSRSLNGPAEQHAGVLKDTVDPKAPGFMGGHRIGYFVWGPAVHAWRTRIARLIRRIIRNLGLVEVGSSPVAVPENLELLMMFDEQTVDRHAITIHHQSVRAGIEVPPYSGSMICAPYPSVVDDGVVAVDLQVDPCAANRRAAYPEKDIVKGDRVLAAAGPASIRSDLEQHWRLDRSGVEQQTGNDDAIRIRGCHGGRAMGRAQRGKA